MISFHSETNFELANAGATATWLQEVIKSEGCKTGELTYIFCDDIYLHKINLEFLNHDTYTDIITFDYTVGKELHGDIYISIDRVKENAQNYNITFANELARVMVHGVLHLIGYKDKSAVDSTIMRGKEDLYISKNGVL